MLPQFIKLLKPKDLPDEDDYYFLLDKKDIEAVEGFERDFHYYHPNNINEYVYLTNYLTNYLNNYLNNIFNLILFI